MIEVAIADDHPLVREGITRVVQNEIDIELVAEAANGKELLTLLQEQLPDIVIVDITMPGKSGLEVIKDIKEQYPELPVLVLSIHPPERFAVRALKAGAQGYLCKSSISEELVIAIRKIVNKKRRYISDEVAEQLAQQMDNVSDQPLHKSLSDREFEIMCMIAQGYDVSKIAKKLSISPHTVHTYRSRIKEKMNLKSNVDMTRYVMDNELIS